MNPEPDWRDALVELHILAEHGDPDAATRAARWLARDPAARHAWDEVHTPATPSEGEPLMSRPPDDDDRCLTGARPSAQAMTSATFRLGVGPRSV